jgi:hypothetical protein
MTDERFDAFAKRLSAATSRRGLLKGALAVALGGVAMRLKGNDADAQTRQACSRLQQACGAGQPACCAHLTCQDGACCRPTNETCYADSDCCPDNVCRPNPHGLGNRCLPPGGVDAACVDAGDCAAEFVCDAYTGTCQPPCLSLGSDCESDADCCSGLICAVDLQRGGALETYCVECLAEGSACLNDQQCCGGVCDPYTATCAACASLTCGLFNNPACGFDSRAFDGFCGCFAKLNGDCYCSPKLQCNERTLCSSDAECAAGEFCGAADNSCGISYCLPPCAFEASRATG